MSSELLESIVHAGHDVVVFADMVKQAYERNGVHVKSRSEFDKFKRSFDLVYSHTDLGVTGYLVSKLQKIPYVGVVHNTGELNRVHVARYKPTLTVWNSESTRQALGGSGGLVCSSPLRIKDHKSNRGDAVTLINLTESKGVEVLIDLANALPQAAFLGVAGGYGYQEHGRVAMAGAEVLGPIPHQLMPSQVWSRTAILLVPSREESWGRVAAEALCSGIPVIAHPTAGLRECLGDAGIFIDRDDQAAWRKEVERLLADPKAYASASKRSAARAQSLEKQTGYQLASFIEALEALVR